MRDATTLLFGLDGFRVVSVTREHEDREQSDDDVRQVVVEGVENEQACPDCGVLSDTVHGRTFRRVKDLPHGRQPLWLWWNQRVGRAGNGGAGGGRSPRPAGRSAAGSA